jgi:hypothetical protein
VRGLGVEVSERQPSADSAASRSIAESTASQDGQRHSTLESHGPPHIAEKRSPPPASRPATVNDPIVVVDHENDAGSHGRGFESRNVSLESESEGGSEAVEKW